MRPGHSSQIARQLPTGSFQLTGCHGRGAEPDDVLRHQRQGRIEQLGERDVVEADDRDRTVQTQPAQRR